MIKKLFISITILCFSATLNAQNKIDITANVDVANKSIGISQTIVYKNESKDILSEIYLSD